MNQAQPSKLYSYGLVSLVLSLMLLIGSLLYWQRAVIPAPEITDKKDVGVRVIVAGDISCAPGMLRTVDSCQMEAVVKEIEARNPVAVLIPGDIQYESGTHDEYKQAFEPLWKNLKAISYAVPGNHEYVTPGAEGYFQYWNGSNNSSRQAGEKGKGYYSFNLNNWHFVGLNSECSAFADGCSKDSAQGKWLAEDLRNNGHVCTLAFWHHPRFTSGVHDQPVEVDRSVDFWHILADDRADIVINGHEHFYERFAPVRHDANIDPVNGVRQFIVGTGGRSIHPFQYVVDAHHEIGVGHFGFLELELYKDSYTWQFRTINNLILDSGRGTCSQKSN